MSATASSSIEISIVVPILNEESNIEELYRRLQNTLSLPFEIIFVNDGSTDSSAQKIEALAKTHPNIRLISFSRNFGHQSAITAGMDFAKGRAVITMDGDLQHPVHLLPQLIDEWKKGSPVVITVRTETQGIGFFKRWSANIFYRVLDFFCEIPMEAGAADFRLLDRQVVDAFKKMDERVRYLRGLTTWLGFKTAKIQYVAEARHSGTTKFSPRKMIRFAIEAITSFSTKPLKLVAAFGVFVIGAGCLYGVWALYAHFVLQLAVPGWTSIILLILFIGGIQISSIGLLGLYIGKIFEEVKRRPIYVVEKTVNL